MPATGLAVLAVLAVDDADADLDPLLSALARARRPHDEADAIVTSRTVPDRLEQAVASGQVRRIHHRPDDGPRAVLRTARDLAQALPDRAAAALWLLRPDAVPAPDALAHLVEALGQNHGTAVAGAKQLLAHPRASPTGASHPDASHPDASQVSDSPADADRGVLELSLLSCGVTLSRGRRVVTGIEHRELDQGQYDHRRSVLAVPADGVLIRAETLVAVEEAQLRGDLDDLVLALCWRVRRAGLRVAVVPEAVVVHTGRPARAPWQQRRSQILRALTQRSGPAVAVMVVLFPLWAIARVLGAIAGHRRGGVPAEIRGWLSALRSLGDVRRERAAIARTSAVQRRALGPLLEPRRRSALRTRDRLLHLVAPGGDDDQRDRAARRVGLGGRVDGRGEGARGRRLLSLVMTLLVTAGTGLYAARGVLGPGTLAGGGLLAPPGTATAHLRAWSDSWVPAGLGAHGPADAAQLVLGVLSIDPAWFVRVLWAGAIPLAALLAWIATAALTRSATARFLLAVAWALAPPLRAALVEGRLGELLAHLLLPLAAACLIRAVRDPRAGRPRPVRTAWAAAGGLLLAAVAAAAPSTAVPLLLALIPLMLVAAGRRTVLLLPVLAVVAVHLPSLPALIERPHALAASIGAVSASPDASPAQLAALWPIDAASASVTGDLLGPVAAAEPYLWAGALLLAALTGIALRGHLAAGAGLLVTALGLAAAVTVRATVVGSDGVAAVSGYPGGPLSVAALGLLVAAAAGLDALSVRAPAGRADTHRPRAGRRHAARTDADHPDAAGSHAAGAHAASAHVARAHAGDDDVRRAERARRAGRIALTTVLAVVLAQSAASAAVTVPVTSRVELQEGSNLPAAARDAAAFPERRASLVLRQDGDTVAGTITRSPLPRLDRTSTLVDARAVQPTGDGWALSAPDAAEEHLISVVAHLVTPDASGPDRGLQTLGVSYVVVPGDLTASAELVTALDASEALQPVTRNEIGGLWRVRAPGSGAQLTAADATAVAAPGPLPADGVPAPTAEPLETEALPAARLGQGVPIAAADGERILQLAQRADQHSVARLDGAALEPVAVDGWAQGFRVPAGAAGTLTVTHQDVRHTAAWIVSAAVLVLLALSALPFGRPRDEEDRP